MKLMGNAEAKGVNDIQNSATSSEVSREELFHNLDFLFHFHLLSPRPGRLLICPNTYSVNREGTGKQVTAVTPEVTWLWGGPGACVITPAG